MSFPQQLIHRIEVAGGGRYLRYLLALLAVALLIITYNLRCYRNLATEEAMDAAQLGRNLAQGKGYVTQFIRPISMHLLAQKKVERSGRPGVGQLAEYSQLTEAHPDLANPPVYPLVLAGLMKVLPFHFDIPRMDEKQKPFWSNNGQFWRYQPDFLIAVFNEALFLILIATTFFWVRRLFDATAAWISCGVLMGTELLWRFSVSGLSTSLLMLIFMGLVWCLTWLESGEGKTARGPVAFYGLTVAIGALVGLGGLTRYAFAWLIIPVLIFLLLFAGPRRLVGCFVALMAFAIVMTPWIIRNCNVSGLPFGIATYTAMENTSSFPEHRLERSLDPDIVVTLQPLRVKLITNLRDMLQNDLFNFGGGWITMFFLVSLMIAFRNPSVSRLRYFLLLSLATLVLAQGFGRTQLSVDSPRINSENLLVLLAPLVVAYAVSLFLLLLDQFSQRRRELRRAAMVLFVFLASLPMVFAMLPPRTVPVVYPPYHPYVIQETAALLKPDELIMSDVPWAVAWYGKRPCLWLTLNAIPESNGSGSSESFFAVQDYQRAINGLYLSPKTLDGRFVSDWFNAGPSGWGAFIVETIQKREPPPSFPLQELAAGYLPEQMFLTDRKRW